MGLLEGRLPEYNTELAFTGQYGTMLLTCSDSKISGGKLKTGQSVIRGSPSEVLKVASALMNEHFALHEEAETEPCSMSVDPVSAIFKNRASRAVWIPVNALTGSASPSLY